MDARLEKLDNRIYFNRIDGHSNRKAGHSNTQARHSQITVRHSIRMDGHSK